MLKVYPYEAIEMGMDAIGSFKVNRSRLKYYIASESLKEEVTCALPDVYPS